MNLCECGDEVKIGNKYISGHNTRVNHPTEKPGVAKKISETLKGKKRKPFSEEWKRNISKNHIDCSGKNSFSWKGGLEGYYHIRAREFFGKPSCEECRISLQEYGRIRKQKNFDMHCVSKDFRILEQWNWKCLCSKCHHLVKGK
jgi:hypothetical protein